MLKWAATIHNSRRAQVSACGQYLISNDGDKGGVRYCLWKRETLLLTVSSGKKRGAFTREKLDVYCRLLKMGALKALKEYADKELING